MRQILFLPSTVLFFTFCLASLSFADIYRYTDEQGTVVLDRQGVPPQYVDKGYQVLNEHGRVIRVVPRAPTAEEIKQMQAEQARRENDERLLRLYSSAEDVGRAKQSKLREFDALIEKTQSQLAPINDKLAYLYDKLAVIRRDRKKTDDPDLALEVSQLKTEQRRLQALIVQYKSQRLKMANEFDEERARLIELLNGSALGVTLSPK